MTMTPALMVAVVALITVEEPMRQRRSQGLTHASQFSLHLCELCADRSDDALNALVINPSSRWWVGAAIVRNGVESRH
jgi:hypothetical protein